MSCFEFFYNLKKKMYKLLGVNMRSLDEFHLIQNRKLISIANELNSTERLALILKQDDEIFNAWKTQKSLKLINYFLLAICAFSIAINF